MAKPKSQWTCSACGHGQALWFAECPRCGEFDTAQEKTADAQRANSRVEMGSLPPAAFRDLKDVSEASYDRVDTGVEEFNRVLGGGLVPGSYIVLAGEPGQGKTTLATEVMIHLARAQRSVAYISGEESEAQARMRFARLGAEFGRYPLPISIERSVERICQFMAQATPDFIVVDSVQTIFSEAVSGAPGSTSQVRECGHKLMNAAKGTGTTVLLIGQVLKSGDIAGPKTLEHMVDAVLEFTGDRAEQVRVLRAIKNRFGTTDEIGLFEMTSEGLVGITDPSTRFVSRRSRPTPGVAVCAVMEGTRPVLVEIQALVSPSNLPQPIRAARGLDNKRVQMLLAVLQRKTRFRVNSMDVNLNVSGGMKIDEPGVDLAICAAIASSIESRPVHEDMALFGEITLPGEVRPAPQASRRRKEAVHLSYRVIDIEGDPPLQDTLSRCLGERVDEGLDREGDDDR
jgi:DNA repair protein RadA/Sms